MKNGLFYFFGLSKKTFSSNFTPVLTVLVLSILAVTPKFYNGSVLMGLWSIIFIFELNSFYRYNGRLRSILNCGIVFVSICILYKLLGISSAQIGYCIIGPFLYFAPVLALMIIDKSNNEQQLKFLLHILALAVAINIAENIRLSYQFGIENLVYQNLGGMMAEEGLSGYNFGGTTFVNMAVFYACIMLFAFLRSNDWLEKRLFLVYFGISAYFIIFRSLKASAVVFLLISVVLMYVSVKSKENAGIVLLLLLVVGVLFTVFQESIIHFLVSVIGSERIANRLIIFTSEGSLEDTSLMSRAELWQTSLQTWLSSVGSFFFGIGDHNWHDFATTIDSGIGNHSDLLDVLARYGIIGAVPLYSSIKVYYFYLVQRYGRSFKYEIISFLILVLLMGFTKKIVNGQPAIMIFILFPLTLKYYSNKTSNTIPILD